MPGRWAHWHRQKRGRKTEPVNPLAAKMMTLQRDNVRLSRRLARAEAVIDIQKVATLLGVPLEPYDGDET